MARTDAHSVVVDAGPLIHLDELGCLDLLSDFSPSIAPDAVWREVSRHRSELLASRIEGFRVVSVQRSPSSQLVVLADALGLAGGEVEALRLTEERGLRTFLTDDAAARLAGEFLGLRVHGTLGIVVRSIRRGLRTRDEVLAILGSVRRRSTLHIAADLLEEIVRKVAQG